jgi:hypothetical protein
MLRPGLYCSALNILDITQPVSNSSDRRIIWVNALAPKLIINHEIIRNHLQSNGVDVALHWRLGIKNMRQLHKPPPTINATRKLPFASLMLADT